MGARKPFIPVYPGGRPRKTSMRDEVDALCYVLRTGCQWRFLPKDFPPKSTVWGYFDEWRHNGIVDAIHDALRDRVRQQEQPGRPRRSASSASQSVDTSSGGEARGRDNAKNVDGRKRPIIVDSLGLLLAVLVTAAKVDDAAGAAPNPQRAIPLARGVTDLRVSARSPVGLQGSSRGEAFRARAGAVAVPLSGGVLPRLPRQPDCTQNPHAGRLVSRHQHEEQIEALRSRRQTPAARALYRLRKQTVERSLADLKEQRSWRRFSGRGLKRARIQWGLTVVAHHLLTVGRALTATTTELNELEKRFT
jgi:transposase